MHRVERQVDGVRRLERLVADDSGCAIDLVGPRALVERRMQHRGKRRGGQRPEERHRRAEASRAARLDRQEVHRERVTGLSTLDEERAGLRVEVARVTHL